MDFHTLLRVENTKLHEDNKALEAELADICERLGGTPGPDGSRLDGENGLAAAVMRAHDHYEASLAKCQGNLQAMTEDYISECQQLRNELAARDKVIGEAVEEMRSDGLFYSTLSWWPKIQQIAAKLEAVVAKDKK